MKILTTLLLAAPLFACALASEMVLPDGSPGYTVGCHGAALTMGDCYEKAGDLCPQGYDILGRDGEAIPFAFGGGQLSGNTTYVQGGYVTTSGLSVTRNLYVRCK